MRYLLLTYNAPGGDEIWAAMTERERQAEEDEFLTGYFLIEAESLDTALEWAAKVPNARSGSVEVRPVAQDDLARRMAAADVEPSG
jgi:hypothetical protein